MRKKQEQDPVDAIVGARLRSLRKKRKMSQGALGDRIGVTYQQVQKYEIGTNRLSASRLVEICSALDVPVSYFFRHIGSDKERVQALHPEFEDLNEIIDFVKSPEGVEFNQMFRRIECKDTQLHLIALIKSLAGERS